MTRRACDLEAKLKMATSELKESNKIQKQLLQEQEESEAEMLMILGQNQSLKRQLAELHTKYEDVLEQMERLQSSLQSVDHCHETYEAALRLNKDLQQELSECRLRIDNLELKQKVPLDNNCNNSLDLQTELLSSLPSSLTIDLSTPNCRGPLPVIKGSNKIKKYIKLNNFIKKSEKKLKMHKKIFENAKLCKDKCNLKEELRACYNLIGRNSLELDHMAEKIIGLERSLHEMTCKLKKSEQEVLDNLKKFDNIVNVVSNDSLYVQVCNSSSQTDIPIYENLSLNEASLSEQTSSCAPTEAQEANVSQSSVRQQQVCQQTRKTVIFSDQIGEGLGRLLGGQLRQNVINNCFPNAPIDHFTKIIKKDSSLDSNTTLILHLGESSSVKRLDIINLVETLLEKLDLGLGKLILCAFPYSQFSTEKENQRVHKANLLFYNLTCRHSDVLYLDTNNFISDFILTKGTMYHSRNSKLIIAKLLAYNIFDGVISSITQLTDEPGVSNITNQGIKKIGTVGQHLN